MGHPREHIKSGKRAWRASPLQDQKIRAEKYAQPRVAVPPRRAKIRGAKYAQKKRWRPEGRRYDKKDGGHDIPAAARNLRYRAPTKQEDGDVKSPLQNRRSEGQNTHRKRDGALKGAATGSKSPHAKTAYGAPTKEEVTQADRPRE